MNNEKFKKQIDVINEVIDIVVANRRCRFYDSVCDGSDVVYSQTMYALEHDQPTAFVPITALLDERLTQLFLEIAVCAIVELERRSTPEMHEAIQRFYLDEKNGERGVVISLEYEPFELELEESL